MITPESNQKSWLIKKGYFDRKPKHLSFTPQSIVFGDQRLSVPTINNSSEEEPLAYRFGIKWIRGFEFTVGRKYQILIKNSDGQIIKISFGSYYGINKVHLYNQYAEILNQLWTTYFDGIVDHYITLFDQKTPFILADVKFDESGIKIKATRFIKEDEKFLLWSDVGSKNYRTYFALFSKQDPSNINKGYSYLDDWNTGVLYSVIETIKGLISKRNQ